MSDDRRTQRRSIVKVNASDVAALIGQNKWKTREEVFERIAIDNGYVDSVLDTTQEELEGYLASEIQTVMQTTTPRDLEALMVEFECKTNQLVVKDLILRQLSQPPLLSTPVEGSAQVVPTLASVCDPTRSIEQNIEACMQHPVVQTFMATSHSLRTLATSINTIRGTQLEERSTDKLEQTLQTPIRDRNSKCYIYRTPEFLLAGRVDGLTDDAVIETKTRRRRWTTPPPYDLIQLRCYMKLCGKQTGILNECFPDGTQRRTTLVWDETEWTRIERGIATAVGEFKALYS